MGRPSIACVVRREFWRLIGRGLPAERAADAVGVSAVRGRRWFRRAGGMAPFSLVEPAGWYLSFADREGIAVL